MLAHMAWNPMTVNDWFAKLAGKFVRRMPEVDFEGREFIPVEDVYAPPEGADWCPFKSSRTASLVTSDSGRPLTTVMVRSIKHDPCSDSCLAIGGSYVETDYGLILDRVAGILVLRNYRTVETQDRRYWDLRASLQDEIQDFLAGQF